MKHYAACSFGKDSIATILLALQHGEPLDGAIYVEVMFDETTSGEIPEHIEWIDHVAIPRLEALGCPVIKLRSEHNLVDHFYHKPTKGAYIGKYRGFPIGGRCTILRDCKLRPMRRFLKSQECIQYVGIAADETVRLARLDGVKRISLLAKYGYTEAMAKELCREYGLLSPLYLTSTRGGCWFCPNQRISQFCELRRNHPELWCRLRQLDTVPGHLRCSPNFKYDLPLAAVEAKMDAYDMQLTLFD